MPDQNQEADAAQDAEQLQQPAVQEDGADLNNRVLQAVQVVEENNLGRRNEEFSSNSFNDDELEELEPREPSLSNVEQANKDG